MSEEKTPEVKEQKGDADNSVAIPLDDLDESKAQLIKNNANGGAGDVTVGIIDPTGRSSDGDVSFNGLGKDEVLQYANDPFWVRLRWILFGLFWLLWVAMLVTAIIIIVVAPRCPPRPDMKWYEKETVYQVYAKSFKDSAKDDKTPMDGFGDFKGLKEKMDYIDDNLGIKAVYLNSIFKTEDLSSAPHLSDMAIIDHKMLDEKFGTSVKKFTSWVKNKRKNGVQIVVDLIPNQTSKKHEWYMKAVDGDAKYKDYYIWTKSPGSQKNVDGESAWSEEPKLGEHYYHSLSADLPDLNLNNEAVREEITKIMKFWLDGGIGGFRINGLDYLVEVDDAANKTSGDGTMKFLEELRTVANSYSDKPGRERFIFGTVTISDANTTANFYESDSEKKEKRLHMVLPELSFDGSCNAECLIDVLKPVTDEVLPWIGLQLSNENTQRIGAKVAADNRFDSGMKVAHALQLLLPGTPFSYYGDEFGQKGGELQEVNNKYNPLNSRTPMQWNGDKNAGFTDDDVKPWNALGSDAATINVEHSEAHFQSDGIFTAFKKLLELREKESFQWGRLEACAPNKDVLLFTRRAEGFPYFLTAINTGRTSQSLALSNIKCVDSREKGFLRFHPRDDVDEELDLSYSMILKPGDIVILEFAA